MGRDDADDDAAVVVVIVVIDVYDCLCLVVAGSLTVPVKTALTRTVARVSRKSENAKNVVDVRVFVCPQRNTHTHMHAHISR